jgi:hypothetical protein
VIVTDTVNPVFHWLCIEYATEQPVAAAADGAAAMAVAPSPVAPRTAAASKTKYLRNLRNFTNTTCTSKSSMAWPGERRSR